MADEAAAATLRDLEEALSLGYLQSFNATNNVIQELKQRLNQSQRQHNTEKQQRERAEEELATAKLQIAELAQENGHQRRAIT